MAFTDFRLNIPKTEGLESEAVRTELFLTAVLFFGLGFLFGKRRPEEKTFENKNAQPGYLNLRNGFGVTSDKNPTFAEQWVNIMNYSGESQTEVDYEETEGA
mgnify:CR=1 FL=1